MLLTRQEDPAKGECSKFQRRDGHDSLSIGIFTDAVSVLNCYLEPAFYRLPRDNVM